MSDDRKEYLQAMGIQVWEANECNNEQEKEHSSHRTDPKPHRSSRSKPVLLRKSCKDTTSVTTVGWGVLEQEVLNCTLCDLSRSRTKVVFGVGDRQAELLLIGEAPGASEDAQGLPFVGRAGLLLNAILQAVGLKREEIYITNILKCRPPNNRDPFPREIDCCTPYLKRQIALIQPRLIVATGRVAAQFLLNTKDSLGKLRKKQYQYGEENTPLVVTYHPAYLLRSPREKAKAYEDWQWIVQLLREGG